MLLAGPSGLRLVARLLGGLKVYSLVRHDCDDIATSDHAKDSYSVRCQHAVIAGSGRSSDDRPLQNVMLKRTPLEGLEVGTIKDPISLSCGVADYGASRTGSVLCAFNSSHL
jgi:hypothetical protein